MIWHAISEMPPPNHVTVLLYRAGDLYPVVGVRWGTDQNSSEPDRVLWILEEGGPEDGEHRGYPLMAREAEPTHWANLPMVPDE